MANATYFFVPILKLLPYFCTSQNRGALNIRAEIKPIEPDTGNAGEGMDKLEMKGFSLFSVGSVTNIKKQN